MQFRRLEIRGFKSFVEKSVIEFRDGITAIVGPNGCGKSNISDALRWVMGEQRARDLRGASMSDVIFGGTQRRAPADYAEVRLKVAADEFPHPYEEFAELEITRRLNARGVSEYLINGTSCRLKDLRSLFLDTGVGTRAMSIIEQGQIHRIVTSRPLERRAVIEEAAGINKFKENKREALAKLETVRANLLRVQDVYEEVERQYEYLKKQASRALRYQELSEQIRELETQLLSWQHQRTQSQIEHCLNALRHNQEHCREQNQQMQELQQRLSREHGQIAEIERNLEALRTRAEELERQRLLLEQQRSGIEDSLQNFDEFADKESTELTDLYRLREALEGEVERFQERVAANAQRLERQQQDLEQRESELQLKRKKLEGLREELELAREENQKILVDISTTRNAITQMENAIRETDNDLRQTRDEEQQERQGLDAVEKEHAEQSRALNTTRDSQRAKHQHYQNQLQRVRDLEQNLDMQRRELAQNEGHKYELQQRLQRAERMLEQLQTEPPRTSIGRLIDHLEIDAADRAAVMALLGPVALGHICRGFSGNLPQIDIDAGSSAEPRDIPGARHISQCCYLRLDADTPQNQPTIPWNAPLYTSEQAETLAVREPQALFSTPDGVLYLGNLCLGPLSSDALQAAELQTQRREWEAQSRALDSQIAERRQALQHSETELEQCREQLALAERAHADAQAELEQQEHQVRDVQTRLHQARRHLEVFERERQNIERRRQEASERVESLKQELKDAGRKQQDIDFEIEDLQHSIEYLEPEIQERQEELSSLRIALARLEENRNADQARLDDKQTKLDETRQRAEQILERMESYREREKESRERIQQIERELEASHQEARTNQQQRETLEESLNSMGAEADSFRNQLATHREQIARAQEQERQLHMELEKANLRMEQLRNRIEEAEIELRDPQQDALSTEMFNEEEATMELGSLKAKLRGLGAVNLDSIDAFRQIEERFVFMQEQRTDLQNSVESIEAGIDRIDRSTRKRFMDTFNAVNEQFQIVFPRLFRGGAAQLRLTDTDPLEAGLEIIAEPPGARPRTLNLLSGGQKTLTAAALIFAIFLVKPSPFCFMDEVDAPLDDSNVVRFSEMVKELATSTQFVIITHNQRTMESADRLYGVTMQEPGVSQLVSVDLANLDPDFLETGT